MYYIEKYVKSRQVWKPVDMEGFDDKDQAREKAANMAEVHGHRYRAAWSDEKPVITKNKRRRPFTPKGWWEGYRDDS